MKETADLFSAIVVTARFSPEQAPGQKTVERCELIFSDTSRLVAYESRTGAKFKYSYQWMNATDQTILRWDNTPHFPQFETFPFHRHVGISEQAEAYPITSLAEVLQFIRDQLINKL